MTTTVADNIDRSPLDHDLEKYFPQLISFNSTEEMERSAVYQEIKSEVERVLTTVVQEDLSELPASAGSVNQVKALAWNIERGNRFQGIADALKDHPELKDKDLLLLTELDYGM